MHKGPAIPSTSLSAEIMSQVTY